MLLKDLLESQSRYANTQKYHGIIPEVKYLPLEVIKRDSSDLELRYEVSSVSDQIANTMDFSEPIEVTAFRFSSNDDDIEPEVKLIDGHHRFAAALQTGKKWLPVELKAINAKGEKLNNLIKLSKEIEDTL